MTRPLQQPLRTSRRHARAGSTLALVSLPLMSICSDAFAATRTTKAVLDHHLGAFAKGLDEIMKDHSAASAILTHDKQYRGVAEIRGFFDGFLKSVKPGFWEVVIRGGKIAMQTFTAG